MLHARSLVASIHFSERQGNSTSALISKNTQPPAPCLPALMTGPMPHQATCTKLHAPSSLPHAHATQSRSGPSPALLTNLPPLLPRPCHFVVFWMISAATNTSARLQGMAKARIPAGSTPMFPITTHIITKAASQAISAVCTMVNLREIR